MTHHVTATDADDRAMASLMADFDAAMTGHTNMVALAALIESLEAMLATLPAESRMATVDRILAAIRRDLRETLT